MTEALAFSPFEESAPIEDLGTKQPGTSKEAHETQFVPAGVFALDVEAYVDDFNARVIGAYEKGTGSHDLPADVGIARSLIPAGTAALRDFSYLSPLLPELLADRCVGCMTCVTECPDTAILGKAVPASRLDAELSRVADDASAPSSAASGPRRGSTSRCRRGRGSRARCSASSSIRPSARDVRSASRSVRTSATTRCGWSRRARRTSAGTVKPSSSIGGSVRRPRST